MVQLSFSLIFCESQPGVAYESVAYTKKRINVLIEFPLRSQCILSYFYKIFLNLLKLNFFKTYNLPFSGSNLVQKLTIFLLYNLLHKKLQFSIINLYCYVANQETNKTVPAFFFSSHIF